MTLLQFCVIGAATGFLLGLAGFRICDWQYWVLDLWVIGCVTWAAS